MIPCDKCGADTKEKEITSKKSGKKYTVLECQGGCMNGKWKYSFFAKEGATQEKQETNPIAIEKIVKVVMENAERLYNIHNNILDIKKELKIADPITVSKDELKPDSNVPW